MATDAQITLPDGARQHYDVHKRRTVDEVKQIVLTRNYKLRGVRPDYFLIFNNTVLVPEYKKFFESHPDLAAALAAVLPPIGTLRLVHRRDVDVTEDGKQHVFNPKPIHDGVSFEDMLQASINRRQQRQSVRMEEEIEKTRMESDLEQRRLRRMSSMLREEQQLQKELEQEEAKRKEILGKRTAEDMRRRREEREKVEQERLRREKEEEEAYQKYRELRRKQKEEAARKRAEERAALLEAPLTMSSRSSTKSPRDEATDELQAQLAKAERDINLRDEEVANLKQLVKKREEELEESRQLQDSLKLKMERAERDVERARQMSESRMQSADKEIALLKAMVGRYKNVRECVAGEIQKCNREPEENVNLLETSIALDRIAARLDQASTGNHWRSTKEEFTICLFNKEELHDLILKYPAKSRSNLVDNSTSSTNSQRLGSSSTAIGSDDTALVTSSSASSTALTPSSSADTPASAVSAVVSSQSLKGPPEPQVEKICKLGEEWEIDYWTILPDFGDLLGEGGYAEVFKGLYRGTRVAVKKFKVNYEALEVGDAPMDVDLIRREIVILSKLNHPNVMRFYGACVILPNICIVTELLTNGSLDALLMKKDHALTIDQRVQFAIDVSLGLEYLHRFSPPVIHRDLKSGNVLLDDKMTAKLSDFGLAKLKVRPFEMPTSKNVKIPSSYTVILNSSPVGTAAWCAPEILEHAPYNELADIYSFGVFLWELATRETPFDGMSGGKIVAAVLDNQRLEVPRDCPAPLGDLMRACWLYDPWDRPNASQLLERLRKAKQELAGSHT